MFYYNVHIRAHIGFNVMALMVEFNSFFLHWRKLLQMVQTPYNCRYYLIIKYLNLITFILFRFGGVSVITWSIFVYGHMVTTVYLVLISFSMLFMNILNPILFSRLVRSDLLRGSGMATLKRDLMATLKRDWMIIINGGEQGLHGNYPSKMEFPGNNNVAGKDWKGD